MTLGGLLGEGAVTVPNVERFFDHEQVLRQRDFERLAKLIQSYSGIKMPANKKQMLEGRLRRRMQEVGIGGLDEYCEYLFDARNFEDEIIHLIDAVTTNKTDFFREPGHFDYLRETALPSIIEPGARAINIWCTAASIGAEPYTLAMVASEFCRSRPGLRYSILATDIDTTVLEQAHTGRFPAAMIEPIPLDMRRDYVLRSRDRETPEIRIVPRLRANVSFARLNLMDATYPVATDFDVIFCRNILIYFDKPTQIKVLLRLCGHLRPGGYLFLGHSESFVGFDLPLVQVANTTFRKR
jgi:chemotaxis protein methyltransferase CheR